MGNTYQVRTVSQNGVGLPASGGVIKEEHLNDEFTSIIAAFNSSTGHSHNGSDSTRVATLGANQELQTTTTSIFPGTTTIDVGTTGSKFRDGFWSGSVKADTAVQTPLVTDTSGNEALKITATGSAVNEFTMANSATGNPITLSSTGTDSNVGITVTPKGTGTLTLNTNTISIGKGGDVDIALTFNANTSDGVLTWMEDEDYFKFSDDVLIDGTEKVQFRDTALTIHSSTDGQLDINADTELAITAPTVDIDASTAVLISNDLKLNSDDAVLGFGASNDTTLTHTSGTGLTLNSTNKLTFGDAASFIQQSSNGVLRIDGEATIDLNASTAVTVSNDLKLDSDGSIITFGAGDEITLTHVHDAGLTITNTVSGTDNRPVILQLKSEENTIATDDVIASLEFAAGDDSTGDAQVVSAGIHAIAEGNFQSDANPTKLIFTTGVSEAATSSATAKMTLSSAGLLTIADDLIIKSGGTIGVASANDAITIASTGIITFKDDIIIKDGGTIGSATTPAAITVASDGVITSSSHISVGGSNNELRFYEGSNYVGFEAPALSANKIWVLPAVDGNADEILKTDGSGNLGWVANTGGATLTGTETLTNKTLTSPAETASIVSTSDGTEALNLGTASVHVVTLGAATTTISFTESLGSTNQAYGFTIILKQDGTGGREVVWPSSSPDIRWADGGNAPVLTSTANRYDVITLVTYDGGDNYHGFVAGQNQY
tara:strand:- start:2013 stop:4172 length:2160 start_codon:yes stop_codon:yes gene_type:complete